MLSYERKRKVACLVDLNYNFERDWLIELSDSKLSDNNLASELVEKKSFSNQSQSRKL